MAKKPPFPPKSDDKKGGKGEKASPKKGNCPDCGKPMSLHKFGKCPK